MRLIRSLKSHVAHDQVIVGIVCGLDRHRDGLFGLFGGPAVKFQSAFHSIIWSVAGWNLSNKVRRTDTCLASATPGISECLSTTSSWQITLTFLFCVECRRVVDQLIFKICARQRNQYSLPDPD